MSYEIFWFILIGALMAVFLIMEGFNFGVGFLQFVLSKNEVERQVYISSVEPHWSGNGVWLVATASAIFAAFPYWFALICTAFYIPFTLLLLSLICRGFCFACRGMLENARLRYYIDILLMVSSFSAVFWVGFFLASLLIGIPIDVYGTFKGSFFGLIRSFGVMGGFTCASILITCGALFLHLKLKGELSMRAFNAAKIASLVSMVVFTLFMVSVTFQQRNIAWHYVLSVVILIFLLLVYIFIISQKPKHAFVSVMIGIAFLIVGLFVALYPNVLISTINKEYNLTIWNVASSKYSLRTTGIAAGIFLPCVIAYQVWSYLVFRKRISSPNKNNIGT